MASAVASLTTVTHDISTYRGPCAAPCVVTPPPRDSWLDSLLVWSQSEPSLSSSALSHKLSLVRAQHALLTRVLEAEAAASASSARHAAMYIEEPYAPWPLPGEVATLFYDGTRGAHTAINATVRGDGWRVWRPTDPPWPAPTKAAEARDEELACAPGALRLGVRTENISLAQPMCLAKGDLISEHIRSKGRWRDCGMHVRLWQALDGRHAGGASNHGGDKWMRLPRLGDPEGVLIELGANIGACTIELLLRTRAKIIAFEPSPVNLFYLTRSLKMLSRRYPQVARRVVVYPVAVSDAPSRLPLYIQQRNFGNSVLLSASRSANRRASHVLGLGSQAVAIEVPVVRIDDIFPTGLGGARAFKIDVQGAECAALLGARHAFAHPSSHNVRVIATEVASQWLDAHCCRAQWLTHLLRTAIGTTIPTNRRLEQLPLTGFQHGREWNVSCLQHAGGNENTCISRRVDAATGVAVPLTLRDEARQPPLRRFHLKAVVSAMKVCRARRQRAHHSATSAPETRSKESRVKSTRQTPTRDRDP